MPRPNLEQLKTEYVQRPEADHSFQVKLHLGYVVYQGAELSSPSVAPSPPSAMLPSGGASCVVGLLEVKLSLGPEAVRIIGGCLMSCANEGTCPSRPRLTPEPSDWEADTAGESASLPTWEPSSPLLLWSKDGDADSAGN
ncbi:ATP-citrate synthase beta chain 1-like protein, putative [Babesia ovata]|uniref:ATP-citrate synthase beta chain 1-like protein, putative n=1 Tax=Babesia ovata TaxID=189622 RepID=A0A2H6KAY4_9APIC|nr:ATP-citrate synthase beta chain 1-like protein, putative [Babesia ovata]GBE60154.1 ATP-citrate synthase beta chain 1-like protein, putative [Babesia ovata]